MNTPTSSPDGPSLGLDHRVNLADLAVTAGRPATKTPDDPLAAAMRHIRQQLVLAGLSPTTQPEETIRLAQDVVQTLALTTTERAQVLEAFARERFGFGPLDPFMKDPEVTEIIVDGPDHVDVERHGQLETVPVSWPSNALLHEYLKSLIQHTGRPLDLAHPIVDAEVQGHRINITAPPVSEFDTLNIRKAVSDTRSYRPHEYVEVGGLDVTGLRILLLLYRAGANMLLCGPMSSGKTTLGRILIEFGARADTRFIALEDTRELQARVPRFVSLQTVIRQEFPITMDMLFAAVKRKRPDRIIVGEVREGVQATPYLMAGMAGHEGGLGTMHAGSPEDAFHNFVFFLTSAGMAVNEQFLMQVLFHTVHVLVFLTKFASGKRRVTRIVAVDPAGAFVDLYRWNFRVQHWEWAHPLLPRLEELCYIAEVPVPTPEDRVTLDDLQSDRLDAWTAPGSESV